MYDKAILKFILSLIFFVLIYAILLALYAKLGITKEQLRNFSEGLGFLGVVFLILFMALSVMSPFPDTPTAVTAIFIYGSGTGFFIVMLGSLLGAVLDFIIVRKLGRKYVNKHAPYVMENVNRLTRKFGFETMVFLRIFPTVTIDIASYTAALTKVKLEMFVVATILGLIPISLTYAIVGIGIESQDWKLIFATLLMGLILLLCIFLISRYYGKKLGINKLEDEE